MYRIKRSSLAIYLITIVVILAIIIFIEPENLIQSFFELELFGIFFLLILYLIDLLVRSYRWKLLLIAQGVEIPVRSLFLPVSSALAINLFTVARAGEAVRIFSLKRQYDTKYSDSLSSIVIEQVLSIIGLLIVVTGSLFLIGYSFQVGEGSQEIQLLLFVLFLVSVGFTIVIGLILIAPSPIYVILGLFPMFIRDKLISAYDAFIRGLKDLRTYPNLFLQSILASALIWILEGFMLYIITLSVFPSFGLSELPLVVAASCAGNITFIVPILPGAVGEYELVIALILSNSPLYEGFGATSVGFLDRIVKSAVLGILGGYATVKLGGTELLKYRDKFTEIKEENI
jgi:uncharacterized protein (TIRG00374 family)